MEIKSGRCGVFASCRDTAMKGTTKTKKISDGTPGMGLSHQIDVTWGPLSHQAVLERSDLEAL